MTAFRLAASLAWVAMLGVADAAAQPSLTPPVQVEGGTVVGTRDGALSSYKGIPFAAPPVLGLRWRPPAPVVSWSGVRIADRFSAMCPQPLRQKHSVFYLGEEPWSEDCLYLNVWSTATAGERRPVMVFVYGGGWTIGSGSLPLYAGDGLARKGAVVVTFNYRVGALGFLAHPELTAEAGGRGSGNYGLMDMVAALQWVRANIARFGGDPANVTLYGQSAGAAGVSLLQTSPRAHGLFHRAIGESGSYAMSGPLPSRADAENAGVASVEKLKASSIAALRNIGADAIMAGDNAQRPILDGVVFLEQPAEVYRTGRQMAVPTLLGANADEGTAYPVAVLPAAFAADARQRYGERADALLALYPAQTDAEARAASYALMRDRTFAAPLRRWALEQAPIAPVFMYHFSRHQPFVEGLSYQQQSPASRLGAYHGAEMAYAFGSLDVLNRSRVTRAWTEDDRKYSETMMTYWINFARTGHPNAAGLVPWPAYTAESEQVMLFAEQMRSGDLPNKPQLDFFKER